MAVSSSMSTCSRSSETVRFGLLKADHRFVTSVACARNLLHGYSNFSVD